MLRDSKLLLESLEPRVVELDLAALNELPRARVVRALLDGEVDPSDRDLILDLVVEYGLERRYDLWEEKVSERKCTYSWVWVGRGARVSSQDGLPTHTPPMSKRTALGGG